MKKLFLLFCLNLISGAYAAKAPAHPSQDKRRTHATGDNKAVDQTDSTSEQNIRCECTQGRVPQCVHALAVMCKPNELKALLDQGASVHAKDSQGSTVLHRAADCNQSGNAIMIPMLLKYGANINARNYYDRTPLYAALGNNDIATVRMLLEHGALINVKDNCDKPPLYEAACREQDKSGCVRLLILNGADETLLNFGPVFREEEGPCYSEYVRRHAQTIQQAKQDREALISRYGEPRTYGTKVERKATISQELKAIVTPQIPADLIPLIVDYDDVINVLGDELLSLGMKEL